MRSAMKGRGRHGFTLVEMLLVITLIGILAAVVVGKYVDVINQGRANATRMTIDALKTAILRYEMDMARYPDKLEDLIKKPDGTGWHGPYIDTGIDGLKDGWGKDIQFTKTDAGCELRSSGRDQIMGNGDDILNSGAPQPGVSN